MICFHSLNYWYLQQLYDFGIQLLKCCDLLSFFELLIFTTTRNSQYVIRTWLWFAFILWTTDIYNNMLHIGVLFRCVVICFHSLNYWYLQQHSPLNNHVLNGCDLLSFFELLIFTTTSVQEYGKYIKLWFAFILWTTDIYNNIKRAIRYWDYVVICFHSLNYWYLQQHGFFWGWATRSCDLLSFFELLIFTTTFHDGVGAEELLWFAFILWTTDIYNNLLFTFNNSLAVVICFHSLNYWYLQQPFVLSIIHFTSCDLLSFFELLIFTTTDLPTQCELLQLWFAFILWTTDIYNNCT